MVLYIIAENGILFGYIFTLFHVIQNENIRLSSLDHMLIYHDYVYTYRRQLKYKDKWM